MPKSSSDILEHNEKDMDAAQLQVETALIQKGKAKDKRPWLLVSENIGNVHFWRLVFAEFFGTFLLMVLGCGGVALNFSIPPPADYLPDALGLMRISFAWGCAVGFIVFTIGHLSAFINPAVTLGAFLMGQISLVRCLIFSVAQCLGSIVGCYCLYLAMPRSREHHYMCTLLSSDLTPMEGYFLETLDTTGLVFGCLAIGTKLQRRPLAASIWLVGIVTFLICFGVCHFSNQFVLS